MIYQALAVFCVALVLSALILWIQRPRTIVRCPYCGTRTKTGYCSPEHRKADEALQLEFLDRFSGTKTFHPEFFYNQSELDSTYNKEQI